MPLLFLNLMYMIWERKKWKTVKKKCSSNLFISSKQNSTLKKIILYKVSGDLWENLFTLVVKER